MLFKPAFYKAGFFIGYKRSLENFPLKMPFDQERHL